uniref:DUF4219 domain-containing protein n=1 Tax=Peronospora matthiolae TaxID=2874970 RepID=A0AAV1TBQ3_9STRA
MSPSSSDSAPAALASAVDASTTSARIDKVDDTNFYMWKFKMQMVQEDRDLWDVTSGDVEQSTVLRPRTKRPQTTLVTHYEKKCLANKLSFLRRRLFATVMEDGGDVLEHINKLRTRAEQLDAVGTLVSDEDLVIALLRSLNDSFQLLITALESRSEEITRELVTSRRMHEDLKRKEKNDGVSASKKGFCTNVKRNKNFWRMLKARADTAANTAIGSQIIMIRPLRIRKREP